MMDEYEEYVLQEIANEYVKVFDDDVLGFVFSITFLWEGVGVASAHNVRDKEIKIYTPLM